MTVGTLKTIIAAYFGKPQSEFVIEGTDLLLTALNSARKKAELVHDFEYTRTEVDLVVDAASGGLISAAKVAGTTTSIAIKSINQGGVVGVNGQVTPVKFVSKKETETIGVVNRYPSDAEISSSVCRRRLVQVGQQIFSYPLGTTGQLSKLRLNAYTWMAEYIIGTETDFMTEHGHDYLKWSAIVEVNYLHQKFVPRQEGNLAPPTTLADQALAALISWDEYVVETARF